MFFPQLNTAFRYKQEDKLLAVPDKCVRGCLKNSFIFFISVYLIMSVDLKCPKAITKSKSMLDDNSKRNVLPGATYLNITFLLTKFRGKGLH